MNGRWQGGLRPGLGAIALCAVVALAAAPAAHAQDVPRWTLVASSNPTNFAPGDHDDQLILTAVGSGADLGRTGKKATASK